MLNYEECGKDFMWEYFTCKFYEIVVTLLCNKKVKINQVIPEYFGSTLTY